MRNVTIIFSVWLLMSGCSPSPEDAAAALEAAKADAQKLVAVMVPEVEELLSGDRFAPFAKKMLADGTIEPTEAGPAGDAGPDRGLESLRAALKKEAATGRLKAAAVAFRETAQVSEAGRMTDAVAISVDHRDGYSVLLLFPYNLSDGVVRWRPPQAQPGREEIFARPAR